MGGSRTPTLVRRTRAQGEGALRLPRTLDDSGRLPPDRFRPHVSRSGQASHPVLGTSSPARTPGGPARSQGRFAEPAPPRAGAPRYELARASTRKTGVVRGTPGRASRSPRRGDSRPGCTAARGVSGAPWWCRRSRRARCGRSRRSPATRRCRPPSPGRSGGLRRRGVVLHEARSARQAGTRHAGDAHQDGGLQSPSDRKS